MRNFLLLFIAIFVFQCSNAQDFSNKGKDFWVGYGYHQVMTAGNSQDMVLYFATDQITTVTVEIPGIGYTQTFPNIPANTIFTTPVMPKAGASDARLLTNGLLNKGIHVTSTKSIVAYAHIYNASVSGACVLLPTNTLGKEYYSINYTNNSNSVNANSWFYVVAADTGITTVEITPSASTVGGWAAGSVNTITLTQGQVYNVMGSLGVNSFCGGNNQPPCTAVDLTGSKIKSIASGTGGCKRIAVYSGSGRISLTCNNTPSSSDNYMVQAFPKSAWGKKFLTASTGGNMTRNIYRVCVSDPATIVKINGVVTALPLIGNFYYEIPFTVNPQKIEGDLPITVAQYVTSQGACSNTNPGDPEVIYLSPVEQSISDVLFNSNLLVAGGPTHFVNVIIPNGGTAISSFRRDGLAVPAASFTVHPQDAAYSYIKIAGLALGQHTLVSDSGFNAIAYGFAAAESYGYNAGTNVRDFNQNLEIQSQYGIINNGGAYSCSNSPFRFKIYLPDSSFSNSGPTAGTNVLVRFDSMKWNVTSPTAFVPNNFPVIVNGTLPLLFPPDPGLKVVPDSTTIRNGKRVAWYSLPTNYAITTPGVYTVTVTGYRTNATSDGCTTGNEIEYNFTLTVAAPPPPSFTYNQPGCPNDPIQFTETTPQGPSPTFYPTYSFWWSFFDPVTNTTTISTIRNPIHTFTTAGVKTVRFFNITTPGCLSDTISQTITVPNLVDATISGTTALCQNGTQPTITFTGTNGVLPYTFTYNINGGASQTISTTGTNTSVTLLPPVNVVGSFAYNLTKVENANPLFCSRVITGQTATITVNPLPTAAIAGTINVCQNTTAPLITFTGANATAPYTFTYNINGGANQTITTITGNSVTIAAPTTTVGTYNYNLVSVVDASSTLCANPAAGIATVVVQATPTATIAGTVSLCQDAPAPSITFNGINGNAPFTFTYNINGGATQTVISPATSNTVTVPVSMAASGTFVYNLLSVQNTGPTTCITNITGASATVIINPVPTATISGTTTVCQVAGAQTLTLTGAGGTAPYTFIYSINGVTQPAVLSTGNVATLTAPVTTVGTFVYNIISVTDASSTLCIRNYPLATQPTATVIVQATSTATIAGTTTICQDAPTPVITFTAANGVRPFTFTYNINGGATLTVSTTAISNSVTVPVSMAASGTFVYNLLSVSNTGSLSCTTPITGASATVIINPVPTATINGTTTVCQVAGAQTVTLTGAGGTAPYTFVYSINGVTQPSVISTGNVATLTAPVTTVGTFVYNIISVTDASSTLCIRNYPLATQPTATVIVQATSTATIAGTTTICQNSPAPVITFTAANGVRPFTFTYNINGGASQTISTTATSSSVTVPVSMAASGTFVYNLLSVSNTGSLSCTTPITGASATVIINPVPTATISGTTTVCQNATAPLVTFTAANGTAPFTFSYTLNAVPQTITTTTGNSVTLAAPTGTVGVFNYVLTSVRDASSTLCTQTQTGTATITVRQLSTATISANVPTVCQASIVAPFITFTATGGVAPYTFTYKINGGANLTATTVVGNSINVPVSTATAGTYIYTLVSVQESSAVTCLNLQTGSAQVIVHPKPTASFTTNAPYCAQNAITFTPTFGITPTGSVTSWVWNYGDGAGPQIRVDGNPFTVTYPTAGVKPVTFKTISDLGCESDLFSNPITINSKPKAGFINPGACLADAFAQFTDTSSVVGGSIVFWEWDFGDGSPVLAGSGPTFQNPLHAYLAVGQKTVTLIVTTNSGCKDTVVQQFFINGEVTRASFTTLNAANLCSNRPVQIRESSLVNVGGLIRVDIYWDYLGAPTVFEQDNVPTPNKIYTHVYPNLQTSVTYKVRYFAYSGFNGVCQKDTIIDVLVNASPVATFAPVQDVCLNGGPVILNQGTASGGTAVYMGPGVTFAGGVYTFDPLATGVVVGTNNNVTYTVTTTAGCDSALVRQVKVLAPPIVNTFTTVGNKCHNNAITFQNTTTNGDGTIVNWIYDWGDGSPIQTMSTGANVTHIYTTTGVKTATLTLQTGYGCRNIPFPLTFTVNPLPVPSYTFTASACLPSANILFTNTTPAPLSGYTFNWSFQLPSTTGANTSTLASPSHIYTTQGPHNTHLIATIIATGCKDSTAIIPITSSTIHPAPVLQFNAIQDVCLNNAGIVSFLPLVSETSGIAGGPGVFSGTGIISANGDFNPLVAGVGTHTITYTWTSTFGCPTTITRQVKVLAPPVINTFTTVGNKCHNNAITFQNTTTNGDGTIVSWIYDWGDGSPIQTMSTGANVTHIYTTTGVKTATLTLQTGYGCRNLPFPLTFTVNPLPVPSYTFTPSACLPSANILFTNTTPAPLSGYTFNWSFQLPSTVPANTSTLASPNHIYTTQGPHNTHLIATIIATGCTDSTAIIPITSSTIHPAPVLQFNAIPDVCLNNGTIQFTQASETSGIAGGPGIYSGVGVSASGVFDPLIAGIGTHNITYTWTSTFNCPTSITQPVKVLADPVVNTFTTVGNLCEQNDIVFANTTTQGAGTIVSWIYDWGDGSPIQTVSNGNNIQHIYATANTTPGYTAKLYVVTNDGCRSLVKTLNVLVNPIPRPSATFTPVACLPSAVVDFTNTTPNVSDWIYSWTFDDVPPTIKTGLNSTFTYTTLGIHPVLLTATSPTTFCRNTAIINVNSIHPAPTASFNFDKPSVCIGDVVRVIDGPSNPADGVMTDWTWNYGDNNATYSGQVRPPYRYSNAGTYIVKLSVKNSFGCVDDTTRSFTVHPYPLVDAGRDSVILQGGNLILSPTVSGNDLTYLWTGTPAPSNLSDPTVLKPLASPVEDITYLLKVTARGGCADTSSVFIKVLKYPVIPNTFTPNNDGVHDFWVIKYLESYPDNRVQVFTRTGQLVFESRRYLKPWDGTLNGKSLPFDTYYYIIEPGSGRKPLTGYVTIIK